MKDQKSKRVVFMFKPRFAPLVEQGTKKQTIRPIGKRKVEVGRIADCREWKGLPYRSNQRKLVEGIILKVAQIEINSECFIIDGSKIFPSPNLDLWAEADGFKNWSEMRDWFEKEHGLPFKGRLIVWE